MGEEAPEQGRQEGLSLEYLDMLVPFVKTSNDAGEAIDNQDLAGVEIVPNDSDEEDTDLSSKWSWLGLMLKQYGTLYV